jgi:hypothetical protein
MLRLNRFVNGPRSFFLAVPLVLSGTSLGLLGCADMEQPDGSGQSLGSNSGTSSASSLNDGDKLRLVSLGMHQMHDQHRHLPAWGNFNAENQPLLSWRVHLLPYLEDGQHQALYDQFHLDEPWDSPHNKPLADQMPAVYQTRGTPRGQTRFRAPVIDQPGVALDKRRTDQDTLFELGPTIEVGENHHLETVKGLRLDDARDGTATVILLVYAPSSEATPWTKPEPLLIDPNNPAAAWSSGGEKKIMVAMSNGQLQNLNASASAATLKHLLMRSDGNRVNVDDAK